MFIMEHLSVMPKIDSNVGHHGEFSLDAEIGQSGWIDVARNTRAY